jgi:hypothetical protein
MVQAEIRSVPTTSERRHGFSVMVDVSVVFPTVSVLGDTLDDATMLASAEAVRHLWDGGFWPL